LTVKKEGGEGKIGALCPGRGRGRRKEGVVHRGHTDSRLTSKPQIQNKRTPEKRGPCGQGGGRRPRADREEGGMGWEAYYTAECYYAGSRGEDSMMEGNEKGELGDKKSMANKSLFRVDQEIIPSRNSLGRDSFRAKTKKEWCRRRKKQVL